MGAKHPPGYDARRRRLERYAAAQLKAAHPDEWAEAWAEGEAAERRRDKALDSPRRPLAVSKPEIDASRDADRASVRAPHDGPTFSDVRQRAIIDFGGQQQL